MESPKGRKSGASTNCHVPPTASADDTYADACAIGRKFAAHLLQYIKDNPQWVGSNRLTLIARDIDFNDEFGSKGYWVGFFSHIERYVAMGCEFFDVFDELKRVEDYEAQAWAAYEK